MCYNMFMVKLNTRVRRWWYRVKHSYLSGGNVVFGLAILLCLFWTYGAIAAMTQNWELAETLREKQQELARLEIEVETMEIENEYYASDEYKELAARRLEDKKLEGEVMVVLPKNSEEAKNKHAESGEDEETERSNFEVWMDFLFRG